MRELSERDKAEVIDGIPESNLVLFCPGLQGRGGSLLDRSQTPSHGTISGASWAGTPRGLKCLSFSGVAQYVTFPYLAAADLTLTMTLMLWFNSTTAVDYRALASKSQGVQGEINLYRPDANSLRIHTYDGVGFWSLDTVINPWDGTWRHVAVRFDGANGYIYLNGALAAGPSAITRVPRVGATEVWRLARYGTAAQYIAARIAMFNLYSADLGAAEILRQYTRQRHIFGV